MKEILVIALLFCWSIICIELGKFVEVEERIAECEATLPRDQHCVLIAIPDNKEVK